MCHRLDRQDVHHTMSLLDEVNRTLDKNSTESLVDFLDRKWEAIQAYDAAMERAKIKALKIKYPGDSQTKASTGAALAAFEDDNTAAVTDQPSDDTDAGDELTLEEEEMLLSGAIKDGIHLKMLVSEILGSPVQPLIMMEDNQGAISYATNAVISDRTKHIDVKWHFVKDHVEAGTVRVHYIATDLNTADMMTKPLPRPALEKHARFAMGW
eukprot:jgi/Tetstr1/425831/TSEL_016208.t1